MSHVIKRKQLEYELSSIPAFLKPKIKYEQYPTSAELASHLLFTCASFGDIGVGKTVVDLGVGVGMLTAGCALLGASHVLGVDIDYDALTQAAETIDQLDLGSSVDLMQMDVCSLLDATYITNMQHQSPSFLLRADTVVMNPPFGTKDSPGIDMKFLTVASKIATGAIYSLHKSTTKTHVCKKALALGWEGSVIAEMRYNLPATYKFHTKKSVDIQVALFRFTPIKV